MLFYGNTVPVLCYHKISECGGLTPEKFEDHLDYLKDNGFETIDSELMYKFITEGAKIPAKPIMLTFDDCHLDNWVYAVPLLNKKGFKGVFFTVTNYIHSAEPRAQLGGVNLPEILSAEKSFIKAINGNPTQFMSSKELYNTVHAYGHEVFSHSQSHQLCFRNLKQTGTYPESYHWGIHGIYEKMQDGLPMFEHGSAYVYNGFWPKNINGKTSFHIRTDEERFKFCQKEFLYSKSILEEILEKQLSSFCWPWGHFDELSMDALKSVGYTNSFTLERAPNIQGSNPFRINRIGVSDKKDVEWLAKRLQVYGRKVLSKLFVKKYKKNREIKNILFITGFDCHSRFTGSIQGMADMDIKLDIAAGRNANLSEEIVKKHNLISIDLREPSIIKDLAKYADEKNIDIIHSFSSTTHMTAVEIKNRMMRSPKLVLHSDSDPKLTPKAKKSVDGFTCDKKSDCDSLIEKGTDKKIVNLLGGHLGENLIRFYSEIF